ncbi:flagellar hook-length control protein FliK [Bradyrhizobium sp.]|uniref:flagellar hook-length control protein FliK n=1 Tax=Bradyrhizobium sp. TaxID=376 RepID=UPI002616C969|nr:flagellar hook-length control protein FliK [Bradyrhizobium sp.]
MAITINPAVQSTTASAPSAAPSGVVLQAGQVISAQVVQVLSNDQVQIAIGNQTIEAATQVPLQAGQTLQLLVSQTPGGIGLAIVNQPSTATGQASAGASTISSPVVTLSPSLAASLATNLTPDLATPTSVLTQLETLAVSVAAQTAATQQASLAPLFADLNAASSLPNLPPQVQQAAAQVLAQQTSLDQNLTADALKQAFQSSGLFLETSLASGSASLSNGVVSDLKAALIVLRQALTSALSNVAESTGTVATASISAPQPGASQATATSGTPPPPGTATADPLTILASGVVPTPAAASIAAQGTATVAAAIEASQLTVQAVPAAVAAELAPQEALAGAPSIVPQASSSTATATASTQGTASATLAQILDLAAGSQNLVTAAAPGDAARSAMSSAALNLLQEVIRASPLAVTNLLQFVSENSQALALLPLVAGVRTTDDAEFARANLPPPPINGALPSAQAVAPAMLSARTPLEAALQHLLADTDGALARQTLLQIASLPGQAGDPSATRIDPSMPRWNFEIPFATPQGTAMAQFEISRDGGGRETPAAKATWRARFSLDVEPAGPVHALVSLNGDRTSVRMWAERPATASQLRAGVSQLTQALSRAELTPGDIVVRDGAPSQAAPASAGHFLNRAS